MGVPKLGRIVAAATAALLWLATGQKDMAKCAPVLAAQPIVQNFSLPIIPSRPISVVGWLINNFNCISFSFTLLFGWPTSFGNKKISIVALVGLREMAKKERDQQQIEFAFMTWPICTVCVSYQAAATALRLARLSLIFHLFFFLYIFFVCTFSVPSTGWCLLQSLVDKYVECLTWANFVTDKTVEHP